MKKLRIKRLERLWTDDRPICAHAFTLIVDGEMVQDDAPCACGGERVTLVAACELEPSPPLQVSSTTHENATRATPTSKSL
jgi:hypothetical protein